jgi:hypothetical protein
MADNTKTMLLLGGGAIALWYLYENGYLASWFGSEFLPTSAVTTTPVTTTPVTTTTAPPTTTSTPATPTPATFAIQGAVKPNVNDSLSAMVSINGGAAQNITIIQSGAEAGHAYNTAGKDITSALTAQGVNVAGLLTAMQAAYVPSIAGMGAMRVPLRLVHGGPGFKIGRSML